MDLLQAMRERHSVRSYTNKPIEGEIKDMLHSFITQCNEESGLHIQLVLEEPIKSFGTYELKAKLGYDVTGTVKVTVSEE